jgi:hypothetical protein
MARFIPPHPKKGSPEAMEWARRMAAARAKKGRQIRKRGKQAERKFFGKGGPLEIRHNLDVKCAWCKKTLGRKPPYQDRSVSHGICAACERVQRAEIAAMKNPKRKYPPVRRNPLAVFGIGNPAKYNIACTANGCTFLRRGLSKKEANFHGSNHANVFKHSVAVNLVESIKKNPPRTVCLSVAGTVYNKVKEIRAEKTVFRKGLYKHPFKGGVKLFALEDGSLLVKSTTGKKLWGRA